MGTNALGYPEVRNFAGLPLERYTVLKRTDVHKVFTWLAHRATGRIPDRHLNSFRDLDRSPCALYHFFNALSYGRKPWFTTFETRLPRWGHVPDAKVRRGMELMARPACQRLIALSERTAAIQRDYATDKVPDLADVLLPKLMVMHPPQRVVMPPDHAKPPIGQGVVFTFVGAHFFRKGGMEMLLAFEALHQRGLREWKLNIVSAMEIGDHATHSTEEDRTKAMAVISRLGDHVKVYRGLSNQGVLDLFLGSHVGLLPTWAETYGYAVLEAQACGCPVVTTDIRAMPEINDDTQGWVIPVAQDELGFARIRTVEAREVFSKHLNDALVDVIGGILLSPGCIAPRAAKALARITAKHDPQASARRLESLYDEALGYRRP